jgi:hypothetical protein
MDAQATPVVLRRLAWVRRLPQALVSCLRTANAGSAEGGRGRDLTVPPEPSRHIEIACDESGFSGGNLTGGQSPVFAHASVRIEPGEAAKLVDSLLRQIGAHGSGEYKAAELLRSRHRPVLLWLLGPASPIRGNACVHLTDTRFFVLARVVDVLLGGEPVNGTACPGQNPGTRRLAITLYRSGEPSYGAHRWQEFLTLAANLLRTNNRWLPKAPVPLFYAALEVMAKTSTAADVHEVMTQLQPTRPIAEATRAAHLQNPKMTPLLEPLIPALTRAVQFWGSCAETVSVVHDEQSALTPERIVDIARTFAASRPDGRLVDVRLVDSRGDARVQLADFVAGIARRLASDDLNGRPDAELLTLLSPLIDHESVWTHHMH